MTAFYTDKVSVRPGECFTVHAASQHSPCRLEIARIGTARTVVASYADIEVGDHPTPDNADALGCNWPVAIEIEAGDWPSGYYDLVLTDAQGARWHHFICIKPATPRAKLLCVLTTNTYNAYNYWGGASAYCDVAGLMSGAKTLPVAMEGAIGILSTQRPFPQLIIASPDDVPRIVNLEKRGFHEAPWASNPEWRARMSPSPYDGSAGFLNKWEHRFVAWAEEQDIALDFATDRDVELEDGLLESYSAVTVVGHSEYWSGGERDAFERYVDGGGNLAIFSGNTAFWKVRFADDGKTFICHKWRGFSDDPDAAEDPSVATHLWSHRAFAKPEAMITGLTFLYGGYHRLGMCVSRGQGGYTVYDPDHWSLADADVAYGDLIGADVPLLGYENDGCRFTFGDDGVPRAVATLGVPANLEIIAIAPCAFGEDPRNPYPPIIPPENLAAIARDVYGDPRLADSPGLIRGHAVMAAFRRGKGEVFNCGTTEWAHSLAAGDPFVEQITFNVLKRFGVVEG